MNGQIVFILWRESIEALLVVGILAGWLAHEGAPRRAAMMLWGGVAAGLAVAAGFALALIGFTEVLSPSLRQDMMTIMLFAASGLIVQMVFWMRAHGPTLKNQLHSGLSKAARSGEWWVLFAIALIAVAREGSETVVFLYGSLAAAGSSDLGAVFASIGLGLVLAAGSYLALRAGARYLPWKAFFRFSEVMLLLLGCALFTTAVGDLVMRGFLPYGTPLWDSTAILDDFTRFGGLVSSLTGYRATPDAVTLGGWAVYWGAVGALMWVQNIRLGLRTA